MRVHHIALRSLDVYALARFYTQMLGLRVVRETAPGRIWLGLEEAVLMIEPREEGEPEIPEGTRELIAFAVSTETRERLRDALVAEGMLEGETEHTLYFRDPEGRRLGVSSYPL